MVETFLNGREKYFNTINCNESSAHGGCWAASSDSSSFFFVCFTFLPFGFLLFILTAYPVSFARFLRKRISSLKMNKSLNQVIVTSIKCTC